MEHVSVYILILAFTSTISQEYTTTIEEYIYETTKKDEEEPSVPRNVTVVDVGSNSIWLKWTRPQYPNGLILGYRVFVQSDTLSITNTVLKDELVEPISHIVEGLLPDSNYSIQVCAFSAKLEGILSEQIFNKTDISGASAPRLLNASCQAPSSLSISWQKPSSFVDHIISYTVYLYTNDHLYKDVTIFVDPEDSGPFNITFNITDYGFFNIHIGSESLSNMTGRYIHGNITEPVSVYMQLDCKEIEKDDSNDIMYIIITGATAVTMILLCGVFWLWKKFFRVSYIFSPDAPSPVPTTNLTWNNVVIISDEQRGPIPIDQFTKHVVLLHADGDIGFSREYEVMQSGLPTFTSECSQQDDNRGKNRYLNIIAYDHTRVHLLPVGEFRYCDYINANYIDGFLVVKNYIGTQGPLPSTFNCFWKMIWEQRVTIIVMITNLVERGRRKCDMYWPKEGTEIFGVIEVKLIKEDIMATYTVRQLQINHTKVSKSGSNEMTKTVFQYHYTNWPDHGTPDHPLPVLHFIKKSASANPPDGGPIVVHCSAGVGRTGTYIVLDAMLKQIRVRNEVNIFGFLRHIRTQRNHLVQTEEQYIFIHEVLLEAIQSGETNISREDFPRYVDALHNNIVENNENRWIPLETQYKLVTAYQHKDVTKLAAYKEQNIPKNRTAIVPLDNSRVHLTPRPGEEGSDYINASWIEGFYSLREFIITQHPLKDTVTDFWKMIWDHNVQNVVLLSIIDEQEYKVFWPCHEEIIETDAFVVQLLEEQVFPSYVELIFKISSSHEDFNFNIRMIYSINWPYHCTSMVEIFNFSDYIQKTQTGFENGPIVVIDKFGGTEAATFCCLATLKHQLVYEGHANIYMFAKLYHNKRPGIWNTLDDYLRLHFTVQAYVTPPKEISEVYDMAKELQNDCNDCIRDSPEETPLIVHQDLEVIIENHVNATTQF